MMIGLTISSDITMRISRLLECKNLQVFWFDNENEDYYQNNMTPPQPNMLPVAGHEIMETRHRKLIKLEYNREKSLAEQKQQAQESHQNTFQDNDLLPHLETSSFSQLEQTKNENQASFDSSVYDVYSDGSEEQMVIRDQSDDNLFLDRSILSCRRIYDSQLILDFRGRQSTQNQKNQMHLKPAQDNNTNLKSQVIHKSPAPPQLINSSKMQATKKPPSFMEYYNSLSKQSNTSNNILDKYIRSKRGQ